MTEDVLKTDGIVDKFIGDAIMAFWGAPVEQPDQADKGAYRIDEYGSKTEKVTG